MEQDINPVETHKIYLSFSCKRWISTKIIGKALTLPKQEDITLNSMTQTREKWDSLVLSKGDFCTIWRCHDIPWFHFYFLFRNNGKREQLSGNDFRRCYGIFFWKTLFRQYLITAMFKVLSQQSWGTLTTAFERHFTIEDFTDVDQHGCWACNKAFDYYCMVLFL